MDIFWFLRSKPAPKTRNTVNRTTLVEPEMVACVVCNRKHLTSVDRTGNRSIVGATAQRRHDQAEKRVTARDSK